MPIVYFSDILVSESFPGLDILREELSKISGNHLKQLTGHHGLYSSRLSNGARILLVKKGKHFILVDYFKSHDDYESTLKDRHLVERYSKRYGIDVNPFESVIEDDASKSVIDEVQSAAQTNFRQADCLLNRIVLLSEEQRAVNLSKPNLILGVAGSGKTSIAVRLCEAASHDATITGKIGFIAPNAALKETVQQHFVDHDAANVQVYTYEDFANSIDSALSTKTRVGKNEFIIWCETLSKELKELQTEIEASRGDKIRKKQNIHETELFYHSLYAEFRLISGYEDEETYVIKSGRSGSSLVTDEKLRAKLYQLYHRYLKSLSVDKYDLSFYDLRAKLTDEHKLLGVLFVDESQILSRLQLKTLLVSGAQVHYCGDNNQNVVGREPFDKYIETLWYQAGIQGEKHYFHYSYRTPKKIIPLANALLRLKEAVTLGSQSKAGYRTMEAVEDSEVATGNVNFIPEEALKDYEAKLTLLCQSADTAIVVDDVSQIETVQKKLNTKLVFTPESILGQEYKYIIAYQLFRKDIFRGVELYATDDLLDKESHSHLPKDRDRKLPNNIVDLNARFVAITRAQEEIIFIYAPVEAKMIRYCQQSIAFSEKEKERDQEATVTLPEINATDEMKRAGWVKRCKELIATGYEATALEIMAEKNITREELGLPIFEEDKKELKTQPKKKSKKKKQTTPEQTKKSVERIYDHLTRFDDDIVLNQAIKIYFDRGMHLEIRYAYYDACLKDNNELKNTIARAWIGKGLPLIDLGKSTDYLNETAGGISKLYMIAKLTPEQLKSNVFKKSITLEMFIRPCEGDASVFSCLVFNNAKLDILEELLTDNNDLTCGLTAALFNQYFLVEQKNITPFFWLCSSDKGNKILSKIIKINPNFSNGLTNEMFTTKIFLQITRTSVSPLHGLIRNNTGMNLLLSFLCENRRLFNLFTKDVLRESSSSGKGKKTIFSILSESVIGRTILNQLRKDFIDLYNEMKNEYDQMDNRYPREQKNSMFKSASTLDANDPTTEFDVGKLENKSLPLQPK